MTTVLRRVGRQALRAIGRDPRRVPLPPATKMLIAPGKHAAPTRREALAGEAVRTGNSLQSALQVPAWP